MPGPGDNGLIDPAPVHTADTAQPDHGLLGTDAAPVMPSITRIRLLGGESK